MFAVTIAPVKTLSRTDPMHTGLHGATAAASVSLASITGTSQDFEPVKERLGDLGLKKSGSKSELVARLREAEDDDWALSPTTRKSESLAAADAAAAAAATRAAAAAAAAAAYSRCCRRRERFLL